MIEVDLRLKPANTYAAWPEFKCFYLSFSRSEKDTDAEGERGREQHLTSEGQTEKIKNQLKFSVINMSKKCTHPHSAATEDTHEHQHSDTHEPSLISAHKLKKPKHFTVTHTHTGTVEEELATAALSSWAQH